MGRKAAILVGISLLMTALSGNVYAESVEIIGENQGENSIGESVILSSLNLQIEKIEVYEAEDEHYAELYVYILTQNMGQENCIIKEQLTAVLNYMSRYEFEMNIDHFSFPTAPQYSVEDYILDPLCEMTVVFHTQIPKAVVEREGELHISLKYGGEEGEKTQFILETADLGEMQEKLVSIDIPYHALRWNGHKYALIYNNSLNIATWEEAEAYCNALGGHLATITSMEENNAIYRFISKYWAQDEMFFGFSDVQEEGTWTWVNGEQSDYTYWHEGEPNNSNNNQNYAIIDGDGTWYDADFNFSSFICEWDVY